LIEQRAIIEELDAPTWKEFSNAINVLKLKLCKVPGLNGVPPEAFKAMDSECRRYELTSSRSISIFILMETEI
jgi:hypothetical protein